MSETENQINANQCLGKIKSLVLMMMLTSVLFLLEIIVGHITKSNSLVADSFHMLSDLISLVIALVAHLVAKRKANEKNTFGWSRAEVLGSLFNAVFLLALCFSIILEAVQRVFDPYPLEHVELMLFTGSVGFAINIFGLVIFGLLGGHHFHSHGMSQNHAPHNHEVTHLTRTRKTIKKWLKNNDAYTIQLDDDEDQEEEEEEEEEKRTPSSVQPHGHSHNMNIHGVFLHILADAFGSLIVVISAIMVKYIQPGREEKWKLYVDPILSLFLTLFITITTIPLVKHSSLIMLQSVPAHVDLASLRKRLLQVSGVLSVHDLHVWSLNPELSVASAHVCLAGRDNKYDPVFYRKTLQTIRKIFENCRIQTSTLQIEYDSSLCDEESNRTHTDLLPHSHGLVGHRDRGF